MQSSRLEGLVVRGNSLYLVKPNKNEISCLVKNIEYMTCIWGASWLAKIKYKEEWNPYNEHLKKEDKNSGFGPDGLKLNGFLHLLWKKPYSESRIAAFTT